MTLFNKGIHEETVRKMSISKEVKDKLDIVLDEMIAKEFLNRVDGKLFMACKGTDLLEDHLLSMENGLRKKEFNWIKSTKMGFSSNWKGQTSVINAAIPSNNYNRNNRFLQEELVFQLEKELDQSLKEFHDKSSKSTNRTSDYTSDTD